MKSLIAFFAVLVIAGGAASIAFAAAETKTVEGELVDLHCYSKGGAKGEGHAKCGTKCLSSGIPAGVIVEGKAMTLATNPQPLAEHAAKTIRVTGAVNAETNVVIPEKIEVNDGGTWKEVSMKDAHHS